MTAASPASALRVAAVAGLVILVAIVDAVRADPQRALSDAVAAYSSLTPIPASTDLDVENATEVQRMLMLSLRPRWGEVVGYKAALTSSAAQQRFAIDRPVLGVLLENMFTTTGSTIQRSSGIRLMLEADLMVRVADASINEASSEEEILASLDQVLPFVEIPDLMFAEGVPILAGDVVAINAGARIGVLGAPVAIADMPDPAARLGSVTVEIVDGDGQRLSAGAGGNLLGHPLRAALWIRDELAGRGISLKQGDLLSLGSMGPPIPIADELDRVTATYTGLGDTPLRIHIGFR